jgi:hypothetical protein
MSQRSPIMAPLAIFRTPLACSPNGLSCLAAYPEPLLKGHPVQPIEFCRLPDFGFTP